MIEVVFLSVVASLLATEGLDWLPRLTHFVIRTAARTLPEGDRDRYYEEWLAEVTHVPGRISKFIYALGLVRASFVMRHPRPSLRILDVITSSLLIVLFIPLFLLICWQVARTGRPVLYRRRYVREDGKQFTCFKFRTMVLEADKVLAEHLAARPEAMLEWRRHHQLRDDPRMTRFGRFLRRTSLDELPKLLNVLRGDMSLISRPVAMEELARGGSRELINLIRASLHHDSVETYRTYYSRVRKMLIRKWQGFRRPW